MGISFLPRIEEEMSTLNETNKLIYENQEVGVLEYYGSAILLVLSFYISQVHW